MNSIEKISLKIPNRNGDSITADFRMIPSEFQKELITGQLPLVIFCHGFKGFKDWGGFPYMMDKIALAGNFAVSFNFSYNGVGEDDEDLVNFTRLDLFAQNTHSRELNDLKDVLNYLEKNKDTYNYDFDNITLIGHSRGGGTAIVFSAGDKRIKKLITLSAISDFDRYSDRLKKQWKQDGFWESENTRTKQMMRLNVTLLEDIENNREALSIETAAEKINIPWLIIHGTEDLAVDYSNAENLKSHNNKETSELILIEKTGHTFGISHPFSGSNQIFDSVIDTVIKFIQN
ncbi:MAG: alpha/beta fold hydrolase [Ignavibacteria bacterium]|nr:alpha/beta fold hydrolase [Ignavibacteria bacterium]